MLGDLILVEGSFEGPEPEGTRPQPNLVAKEHQGKQGPNGHSHHTLRRTLIPPHIED